MACGLYDVSPGGRIRVVSTFAPNANTVIQLSRTPRTLNDIFFSAQIQPFSAFLVHFVFGAKCPKS